MSASDHLHPEQFKGYKPAHEEGKAAREWLSTGEGHAWQDNLPRVEHQFWEHSSDTAGIFSIKPGSIAEHSEIWDKFDAAYHHGPSAGNYGGPGVDHMKISNGYRPGQPRHFVRKLYEKDSPK